MVFYSALEKLGPTKLFHSIVIGLSQATVWKELSRQPYSQNHKPALPS